MSYLKSLVEQVVDRKRLQRLDLTFVWTRHVHDTGRSHVTDNSSRSIGLLAYQSAYSSSCIMKSSFTIFPAITSCARGDTICLHPVQVDNIFTFIRQVAVLFRHNNIFVFIRQVAPVPACWLFKTSITSWPLTFWPWKWCPSHVWRGLPLCQL